MDSPDTEKLADPLPSVSKLTEIRSASITTVSRACDPTDSVFCIDVRSHTIPIIIDYII